MLSETDPESTSLGINVEFNIKLNIIHQLLKASVVNSAYWELNFHQLKSMGKFIQLRFIC